MRASHTKERQIWVDRLRACAHRHNLVGWKISNSSKRETKFKGAELFFDKCTPPCVEITMIPSMRESQGFLQVDQITRGSAARQEVGRERPLTPPGARSHIADGEPSEQLQTLSLSALDAFGSVHDMLRKVEDKHRALAEAIEGLPIGKEGSSGRERGKCHDPQLLVLKATSQSTLLCMEAALGMLQDIREGQLEGPVVVHQSLPRPKTLSQTSSALLPASPSRTSSTSSTPRSARSSRY